MILSISDTCLIHDSSHVQITNKRGYQQIIKDTTNDKPNQYYQYKYDEYNEMSEGNIYQISAEKDQQKIQV